MINISFKQNVNQVKLKALLESNYAQLYRVAYAWCQDTSLAQDLVQETMLKSLQKAHTLSSFEHIDRWLCKMMHNIFYDNCRHNARWQLFDVDEFSEQLHTDSVETLYIKKQDVQNIHDAIGVLPFDQREVITLIDLQGYSYQEVAEILEIPVGTVMSRLSRAREKLKNLITHEKFIPHYQNNVVDLKKSIQK